MTKRRLMASVERLSGWTVMLMLGIGLICVGTRANAAPPPVECGAVVTQNIKLLADVGPCAGDGLIVAVNGVSINLNGHKISAAQRRNVGIRLESVSNVSVVGGTIEGFDTGVLIVGGLADTVANMTLRDNRFGVQVQNAPLSGHHISKNVAINNRLIGILLNPNVSGVTVNKNSVSRNVGYGIVLDGGSSLNVVSDNDALGNDEIHHDYSGSRDMVVRAAIFEVPRTNLVAPLFTLVSPSRMQYILGVDYQVLAAGDLSGHPGFDVTGRLIPVGVTLGSTATSIENPVPVDTSTSGCLLADYIAAGFQPGNVALVQRGTCELDVKVHVASIAGAAGVIVFNEGQAPDRGTSNFGNIGSFPQLALSASYSLGYQLYNLSRTGPLTIRLVAKTLAQPFPATAASNSNQVIKNFADHAWDDNGGQAISADVFLCGTNQWVKNSIGGVGTAPCFVGPGGGGSGATIHSY
jgi:hypothetical protein